MEHREAGVAVGHERAHAEFGAQPKRFLEQVLSRRLSGLRAAHLALSQQPQRPRLKSALAARSRPLLGSLRHRLRVSDASSQKIRLAEIRQPPAPQPREMDAVQMRDVLFEYREPCGG